MEEKLFIEKRLLIKKWSVAINPLQLIASHVFFIGAIKMSQPKSMFNISLKKFLGIFLEDLVAYFWPERNSKIDWQNGIKVRGGVYV